MGSLLLEHDTIHLVEQVAAIDTVVIALSDGAVGSSSSNRDQIYGFTAGLSAGDIINVDPDIALVDGDSGTALTTAGNSNNELASSMFTSSATHASLNVAGKGIYVFSTTDFSLDYDLATPLTDDPDDFIIAVIADGLGTANWTGNKLSGDANTAVVQGGANSELLLVFTDGTDTAVVHYAEGAESEASFTGELTLLAMLYGVDAADLTVDNFFA